MDVKSEIDDDDSDNLNEEDELDDDINIEDEDFSQFGIAVGEDILRVYYSARMINKLSNSQKQSSKPSAPNSAVKKDNNENFFRPITPSLKNSFNQRKQTPVYNNKRIDSLLNTNEQLEDYKRDSSFHREQVNNDDNEDNQEPNELDYEIDINDKIN